MSREACGGPALTARPGRPRQSGRRARLAPTPRADPACPNRPRPDRLDAAGVAAPSSAASSGAATRSRSSTPSPTTPCPRSAARRSGSLISLPVVGLVCLRGGAGFGVARRHWWLLVLHGVLTAVADRHVQLGDQPQRGGPVVGLHQHPPAGRRPAGLARPRRAPRRRGLVGLLAAAAGVAVCWPAPERGGGLAGDLVVLASGVVFGVQTIAQKKTFPLIPPGRSCSPRRPWRRPAHVGLRACSSRGRAPTTSPRGGRGRALPGPGRLGRLLQRSG